MTTNPTPKQRAVIDFWDDQTLLKIADAPANFWDDCNWWQKALVVFLAVLLCIVVGGMVAGVLVGYAK
jgi:hypothetical protein